MAVAKQLVVVLGGKVKFIGFQIYFALLGQTDIYAVYRRNLYFWSFYSISMETVFTSQTSLSVVPQLVPIQPLDTSTLAPHQNHIE